MTEQACKNNRWKRGGWYSRDRKQPLRHKGTEWVKAHWGEKLGGCCCCEVASVVSDSVRPHRRQPTRLPRPWDSPGKNTGVSCHLESSNTEGSGDKIVENAHKPFQWLQTFQPIGNRELLKNWQQERCHVLEILSSRKTSWRAVEEEWNLWLDLWELLIQSW